MYENIILPVSLDGGKPDELYLKKIISLLGLQEKLTELPGKLSGGQQQRVAIARPWHLNRRSCWQMSLLAIWILRPARM